MNSFSKTSGTLVAKNKGVPVFISEDKPKHLLLPKMDRIVSQDVERAIRTGIAPKESVARSVYESLDKNEAKTEMEGEFEPVFGSNMETNRIAYIFGASGCGKSTQTRILADSWRSTHRKDPIYIFSRFDGDSDSSLKMKAEFISEADVLSHLEDTGLPLKMSNLTTPCLIICDDYDSFTKKAYESVAETMKDALECGRKLGVSMIITSHLAVDKSKPLLRTIWNESHLIGLFPSASQGRLVKYALESYCGLDSKQHSKMLKLPSRCVFLRKVYPQAVISNHFMYLL